MVESTAVPAFTNERILWGGRKTIHIFESSLRFQPPDPNVIRNGAPHIRNYHVN